MYPQLLAVLRLDHRLSQGSAFLAIPRPGRDAADTVSAAEGVELLGEGGLLSSRRLCQYQLTPAAERSSVQYLMTNSLVRFAKWMQCACQVAAVHLRVRDVHVSMPYKTFSKGCGL